MPETDPQNPAQGDPELGDAGKRAIKAERDRADAAEREANALRARLKPFEDAGITDATAAKAELERLAAENAALTNDLNVRTLEVARLNVGIDKGLPKAFINRLSGNDEAELAADADTLLPLLAGKTDPFPKADPSQGAAGKSGAPTNADTFAEQLADF